MPNATLKGSLTRLSSGLYTFVGNTGKTQLTISITVSINGDQLLHDKVSGSDYSFTREDLNKWADEGFGTESLAQLSVNSSEKL